MIRLDISVKIKKERRKERNLILMEKRFSQQQQVLLILILIVKYKTLYNHKVLGTIILINIKLFTSIFSLFSLGLRKTMLLKYPRYRYFIAQNIVTFFGKLDLLVIITYYCFSFCYLFYQFMVLCGLLNIWCITFIIPIFEIFQTLGQVCNWQSKYMI